MPDDQKTAQEFAAFCAARGHDDPQKMTAPLMRALVKLFNEERHLANANRDAFGDNLPQE